MTPLRTERLILRNWRAGDRDLFRRINADDQVMEFFPFRRSVEEADAFLERLIAENEAVGYGWAAAEIADTGETIGFIGIHAAEIEPIVPSGSIEIGWRLAPEFWGRGYVTEGARAWLGFAFDVLKVPEVLSFAVETNVRSIAVMQRLGMQRVGSFDHPAVPDTHPDLRRHVLYRISAPGT